MIACAASTWRLRVAASPPPSCHLTPLSLSSCYLHQSDPARLDASTTAKRSHGWSPKTPTSAALKYRGCITPQGFPLPSHAFGDLTSERTGASSSCHVHTQQPLLQVIRTHDAMCLKESCLRAVASSRARAIVLCPQDRQRPCRIVKLYVDRLGAASHSRMTRYGTGVCANAPQNASRARLAF
eukprot:4358006-Pleurochrysis_carterae.AAC.1